MNKQIQRYMVFVAIVALFGGSAPALAYSVEVRGGGEGGVGTVRVQTPSATLIKVDDEEGDIDLEDADDDRSATSSAQREVEKHRQEKVRELLKEGVFFSLEGTTTQALSLGQLKKLMEARKHELDDEEASSTPERRDIVKNTNPVRLAVHSLLVSKDILGGIGPQVSEIAKHMNDSVASTTVAEVKIQSRGFLAKIFFGGDTTAAQIIEGEVEKNQERINELNKLLTEASIATDVRVTIAAQIAAIQEAQVRLEALAQREQNRWGIFSWRF